MAQLLIRNLDDDVKENLRKRAHRQGTSMESLARDIFRAALLRPEDEIYGLGTRIAALFKDIPDNDEPLPELPRGRLRLPDFI